MPALRVGLLAAAILSGPAVLSLPAFAAGNNNSPPAGAILDLGGGETGTAAQTVNHGAPITETAYFTAALTNTAITFAFRDDPAFISFGDLVLTDLTTGSANLFTNPDFSGGVYNDNGNGGTPVGWIYANIYGATFGGQIQSCSGFSGGYCWYDGAVQAYDALSQTVATTIGDVYQLSFDYSENGSLTTMSDLSTNGDTTDTGGNGIDVLAYAQNGLPVACTPGTVCTGNPVPEPDSLPLIGTGLLALWLIRRRFAV